MKRFLVLLALALFLSACGAGQPKSTTAAPAENKSANQSVADKNDKTNEAEKPNLTPVTITAGSLFTGNYRYASDVEEFKTKYADRALTISDLYLWEISLSELRASDKKEPGGNFVKCEGSFGDYLDSASKIKKIREKGNPMKATLRGRMKSADEYAGAGQLQVVLTDRVLAEIKK